MKITDRELLRLIWLYQLKLTAKNVLVHYVGDVYGVCGETHYEYAVGISRSARGNITKRISESQLLVRMKDLINSRKLARYGYPLFCTCWINAWQSRQAFDAARNWWLIQGIPEGFDTDKNCCKTVACDNIQQLTADCTAFLLKNFGDARIDYLK